MSVSPGFGALTGGSNTTVSVQEGLNQVRTTPSESLFLYSNPRFLMIDMNCHPSTKTPLPPFGQREPYTHSPTPQPLNPAPSGAALVEDFSHTLSNSHTLTLSRSHTLSVTALNSQPLPGRRGALQLRRLRHSGHLHLPLAHLLPDPPRRDPRPRPALADVRAVALQDAPCDVRVCRAVPRRCDPPLCGPKVHPEPYTLHPTPYTLHPTPCRPHPTLCTLLCSV